VGGVAVVGAVEATAFGGAGALVCLIDSMI
jgi:hypothetical protein